MVVITFATAQSQAKATVPVEFTADGKLKQPVGYRKCRSSTLAGVEVRICLLVHEAQ